MNAKKVVELMLRRFPPLYQLGSRVYQKMNGSFRALSAGAPEAIRKALERVQELKGDAPGDYYEFGVFGGYTLLSAQQSSTNLALRDMKFYGFDSFKGFPPIESIDRNSNQFFEGQFACSKDDVMQNLTGHGADLSRIELIEGFYSDSLTSSLKAEHPFQPVAVAFIDCDLYASTRDVLRWLASFLTEHSILVFDDWFVFGDTDEYGEQKAFAEFLGENPDIKAEPFCTFEPYGKAFILRRV